MTWFGHHDQSSGPIVALAALAEDRTKLEGEAAAARSLGSHVLLGEEFTPLDGARRPIQRSCGRYGKFVTSLGQRRVYSVASALSNVADG